MKNCKYCGKEFAANRSTQVYCSKECYDKGRPRKKYTRIEDTVYTCLNCGKEYNPKSKERNKFCSRECAYKYKTKNKKTSQKKGTAAVLTKTCKTCGKGFETKSKAKIECGECIYERAKTRATERCKALAREKYNREVKPIQCHHCGKEFIPPLNPRWRTMRFCSTECGKKHAKYMRRYRQRMNGESDVSPSYYAGRYEVVKEHGWVCGICGEQISRELKYPDPMSLSIDHIMPLAKGGTHAMENLQPAHLICNSLKRDLVV